MFFFLTGMDLVANIIISRMISTFRSHVYLKKFNHHIGTFLLSSDKHLTRQPEGLVSSMAVSIRSDTPSVVYFL